MTLSSRSAERIALLYRAAKRNGSLVSAEELSKLLPENASRTEVEDAIATMPSLRARFELRSGYLTERDAVHSVDPLRLEEDSRRTARRNFLHAAEFAPLLRTSGFGLLAVSGSTSYGSASLSKDADLFCVAPAGKMWLSLTRGLLMARVYALLHRDAPSVCLSCVMDWDYARATFEHRRHPLFARDAVEAKVFVGKALYSSLLRTAGWISDYYPVAYAHAVSSPSPANPRPASALSRLLNGVLYILIGRYMLAKSSLLNRRLKNGRRNGAVFAVRSGPDHLIYESRRYIDLKKEYEMAESSSRGHAITS